MAQNYLCVCERCRSICPAGRNVSHTTYFRHRRTRQGALGGLRFLCTCLDHPNGHLLSRSSYYRHREQLQRRGAEPPLLRSVDDPDSNSPPTFDLELELNSAPSDSERSDASNETSPEGEDNLELEDGASDFLQEEDDPEVSSHRQLLSIYTEGATSRAESECGDDLDGVFGSSGSSTFVTLRASFDAF